MRQVVVIGGGLAGLVSAIHLSKLGLEVMLIEKNTYPRHKVCGEYISNEVLPYLKYLEFDPFEHGAKAIDQLTFSTTSGKTMSSQLPLGGFGISRYCIDQALANKAISNGVKIIHAAVSDVQFVDEGFQISTNDAKEYKAEIVIGAFGKRSNIDVNLDRSFMKESSPYLAVKAHYEGEFPDDLVCLHNFDGGYCGLSKVESDRINVCYITDYKSFKKYKNIADFENKVVSKNKYMKEAFGNLTLVFDKPLTISQISFATKKPVENHVIMCGDSASMIHPLAGNGMGMAIRSAYIASDLIYKYFAGEISSRVELENRYTQNWKKEFQTRLTVGHIIARLFKISFLTEGLATLIKVFPSVLRSIIKMTHGKPMKV